ncbi:hypothetical protein KM043_007116 [Ampulex compressa]|nr:hypothetical protein KM043_007116 [Ampulex compressa]
MAKGQRQIDGGKEKKKPTVAGGLFMCLTRLWSRVLDFAGRMDEWMRLIGRAPGERTQGEKKVTQSGMKRGVKGGGANGKATAGSWYPHVETARLRSAIGVRAWLGLVRSACEGGGKQGRRDKLKICPPRKEYSVGISGRAPPSRFLYDDDVFTRNNSPEIPEQQLPMSRGKFTK